MTDINRSSFYSYVKWIPRGEESMPKCEGLPNNKCPKEVNDSTVELRQGDLLLCRDCTIARFGEPRAVIKQLTDITDIPLANIDEVFENSLQCVFGYPQIDIQNTLGQLDMDTLMKISKKLCENIVTIFPEYKDRRCVNRVAKHKLIADIYSLGYSLVNKKAMRELEKIFPQKLVQNKETTDDEAELSNLIKTITSLKRRLDEVEKELSSVKINNIALGERVKAFELSRTAESKGVRQHNEENSNRQDVGVLNRNVPSDSEPSSDTDDDTSATPINRPTHPHGSHAEGGDENGAEDCRDVEGVEGVDVPAGEFRLPSHQIKKIKQKKKRQKNNKSRDSKPQTASGNNISASPTIMLSEIYVGQVDPGHSEEDIREHLRSMGVCEQVLVTTLSHKQTYRSFKVCVPSSDLKNVLNVNMWPRGLVIRPFRKSKESLRAAPQTRHTDRPFQNRRIYGGKRSYAAGRSWQWPRANRSQSSHRQYQPWRHEERYQPDHGTWDGANEFQYRANSDYHGTRDSTKGSQYRPNSSYHRTWDNSGYGECGEW